VAQREVERLDQIISQFLRALRPSQPRLRGIAALSDVLQETLTFLKQEIKDRDVLVEVDTPDDLPAAQMDRNQMKQAFFNIIRNAMQAMPNGGLLKIIASGSPTALSSSPSPTPDPASGRRCWAPSSSRTSPPRRGRGWA
jgi:two-component system, sporulation sensor kinase E